MALDHCRIIRPGKKFGPNFLRSTSLLYKILPTNLGACKPTFYTFYTSHLRWNSTMRRCFYHTDLGQNAVFYNFAIQIALIQYSGRSKHAWAFSENNFQNHPYGQPVASCGVFECTLIELPFNNNNKNYVYFLSCFLTMCNLQKRLIRSAFWVLLQAMFMNDWKQRAQRLKLQERLPDNH